MQLHRKFYIAGRMQCCLHSGWCPFSGRNKTKKNALLQAAHDLQKSGAEMFVLEDIDFGKRYALEKEIRAAGDSVPAPNAVFDESGNFLLYPSLVGIKVVNLVSSACVKILGKVENTERFLRVALYQGSSKKVRGWVKRREILGFGEGGGGRGLGSGEEGKAIGGCLGQAMAMGYKEGEAECWRSERGRWVRGVLGQRWGGEHSGGGMA